MYSRKSVGPRMEPWGSPALTGSSCKDFPSRTIRSRPLLRQDELCPNIWPEIRLKFVQKTSMPNPVESFGYIKCYCSIRPRPVESPGNSIRYNCQKICSWSKEILERSKFCSNMLKPSHKKIQNTGINPFVPNAPFLYFLQGNQEKVREFDFGL